MFGEIAVFHHIPDPFQVWVQGRCPPAVRSHEVLTKCGGAHVQFLADLLHGLPGIKKFRHHLTIKRHLEVEFPEEFEADPCTCTVLLSFLIAERPRNLGIVFSRHSTQPRALRAAAGASFGLK